MSIMIRWRGWMIRGFALYRLSRHWSRGKPVVWASDGKSLRFGKKPNSWWQWDKVL